MLETDQCHDEASRDTLWNVSFLWPSWVAAALAAVVGYALDDVVVGLIVYALVMLFPVVQFLSRVFAVVCWDWWLGAWIRGRENETRST